ncbi:unnamed protein product [Hymenolepis diminuta]|nr:unnamed protein product [Hymenolepis diminuta]
MINANFPQVLDAADDIGFETMRSDTTNVTSAGLSTLYLQAKSTSTPSLLAELSLSESTKKAINNLERCLQDIGPESGIGISPADFGEYGSFSDNPQTSSNLLAPPPNEHKWSLNSSLEIGETGSEEEEACQLSLYTAPDTRVERQLYSLDGNRRSSFESVYSPPVVSEQVVNEVIHVPSHKVTVFIQDDTPKIRPVKEITPPPRTPQRTETPAPSSNSVTTSISEIISTPPSEPSPTIPENSDKEIDASSTHSAATLGKEDHIQLAEAVNQSEDSEAESERRGLITTVVTVPIACEGQSGERKDSAKITPKPRIQTVIQRPKNMESIEDDYEWARKIQEIAQWQADVNLAMQNGVSNGTFINSPGDEVGEESIISESHRPKPLKRRNRPVADQKTIIQRPTMVTTRTFECNSQPGPGNKLESMQRLLQPSALSFGENTRNDMFSRRFGISPNPTGNRQTPFPKPLPIPSGNAPELSKSANFKRESPVYHVIDLSKQNGKNSLSPTQVHPKVSVLVPTFWNVDTKPSYHTRDSGISFPRHDLSGYAEALSLATAANNALSEAFSMRGGYAAKPTFQRPMASQTNDALSYQQFRPHGYKNGFKDDRINSEPAKIAQPTHTITVNCLNGHNDQPISKSNIISFNGTGRIKIPARSIPLANATPSAFRIQTPITEPSSKHSTPLRNHINLTPSPLADINNIRSPHSSTPTRAKSPKFMVTTRSRSVGPTIIPPPPNATSYPLVTDLSKGLEIITTNHNNSKISNRVQALPPKKFILGRVASNEDICIETETPFAFSIAAKGKQICIAKVASADDLQRPSFVGDFSADLEDKEDTDEGVPVSLRLTFGSTPCVSSVGSKPAIRESSLNKTFRSVLHIDMSSSGNSAGKKLGRPQLRPPKSLVNGTPFRNSLPSLPRPPRQSQGANLTFFEQDIWYE